MNTLNQFGDFQKIGQANMETTMQFFGEFGKSWQAIVAEMTDYTKRSIEDGSAHVENLKSAKSIEQAFEIQTDYAKSAYEGYMQQMNKIGSMYSEMAQEVYKPIEKALK
ncbi:MAG: phasin family protein [Hyphomicrobiaceae bacterium]